MRRRSFLAGSAASVLAGPASAKLQVPIRNTQTLNAPLAPVKSARDRLIETIVGLRPYRRSGFRLESRRAGDKHIIHNYGHGGAGVSLSWGCAEIAADMARKTGSPQIAILGAGVMGLTTARVLQQQGAKVTIYAEDFPPNTTSNIAGALWWPSMVFSRGQGTSRFLKVYRTAKRRSFTRFKQFTSDPRYGVHWVRHFFLRQALSASNAANNDLNEEFALAEDDFYPGFIETSNVEGPFGFQHVTAYYTLMIDTDIYLQALVDDFVSAGGQMVDKRFENQRDVRGLDESTVVNCTGLGAAKLFGDKTLIPVRGQLSLLRPQPEIDYSYITSTSGGQLYMFPRQSAIVLGGSVGFGNSSTEIDVKETTRVIDGHAELAARLKRKPLKEI